MASQTWADITYPFQNFNGCIVDPELLMSYKDLTTWQGIEIVGQAMDSSPHVSFFEHLIETFVVSVTDSETKYIGMY